MRNIWVISDTHFWHANIIKYCDRPFADVKEMNDVMVERWNSVVKEQDIVYHLGDVYFGKEGRDVISKLNGHKRLILGNHDNGKDQNLLKHFEKIMMWRMFPDLGLLFTHVPVHFSSLQRFDKEGNPSGNLRNVHGHVHKNSVKMFETRWATEPVNDLNYINVSVEMIDYTPVHVDSLLTKG